MNRSGRMLPDFMMLGLLLAIILLFVLGGWLTRAVLGVVIGGYIAVVAYWEWNLRLRPGDRVRVRGDGSAAARGTVVAAGREPDTVDVRLDGEVASRAFSRYALEKV